MSDEDEDRYDFEIGRAITYAFRGFGQNFIVFASLSTAVVVGLYAALIGGVILAVGIDNGFDFKALESADPGVAVTTVVLFFVALALMIGFTQALGAYGATCMIQKRKARFADAWSAGWRNTLQVAVIIVIASAAIFFASFFFVVPGVILAVMFSLAVPAQVVDKTGVFGSFGESWGISENNRFILFGYLLLCRLMLIVGGFTLFMLAGLAFSAPLAAMKVDEVTPSTVAALGIGLSFLALSILFVVTMLLLAAAIPAGAYVEFRSLKQNRRTNADLARKAAAALFDRD